MRFDTRFRSSGLFYSARLPVAVKWLLISNITLFLLYFVAVRTGSAEFFRLMALTPRAVLEHFAVWQLVTYMFLHDPFGFSHIIFNMLALWMFGSDLERDWGTRPFLKYYFLCGVGAGVCDVVANVLVGTMNTRTIGASGAIYGLLLAYGVLYPNRTVLYGFLFPIPAKYFVMIIGVVTFLSSFGSNSGVSHVAHLGGMIFGFAYLKLRFRRIDFRRIEREYKAWKLRRAKRKFEVYLRKQEDRNRGPWVN